MNRVGFDARVVFSYAFRPFFLLAGAFALLAIPAWGLHLGGWLGWPDHLPAMVRHGHEMLFGFAGAAIAGFLLTAVATWTGRPAVAGTPLLSLAGLWLAARVGAFIPAWGLLWGSASVLFWGYLLALMARELTVTRNRRNYKVLFLLAGFLAAEVYFFLPHPDPLAGKETALRLGLTLVIGMILLVGGRIIPSFTQNWLRLHRPELTVSLPPFGGFDALAVALGAGYGLAFVIHPQGTGTGLLGFLAAALQLARLLRWRGWLAAREPLLWVLHLGYGWIPIGLVLLGASALVPGPTLWDAGLHALGYGAIGTLILGVAARVALGHTGRPLRAFPPLTWAFALMTLGTACRLFAFPGGWLMALSVVLWFGAYSLFLGRYLPILLAPRLDS
ncbi:NnrS family protein [Candidatus Methylocalor cossyra]|uniref:NnrS protein involved in response to NO n=1 Tax=Candidatus Methylocalor cossyra TaxID=3108543 RepID=A0ABM9NKK8_9GAMM